MPDRRAAMLLTTVLAVLLFAAPPASAAAAELECSLSEEEDPATGQTSHSTSCAVAGQETRLPGSSHAYAAAGILHSLAMRSGACSADGACVESDVVSVSYGQHDTSSKKYYTGHVTLLKQ